MVGAAASLGAGELQLDEHHVFSQPHGQREGTLARQEVIHLRHTNGTHVRGAYKKNEWCVIGHGVELQGWL